MIEKTERGKHTLAATFNFKKEKKNNNNHCTIILILSSFILQCFIYLFIIFFYFLQVARIFWYAGIVGKCSMIWWIWWNTNETTASYDSLANVTHSMKMENVWMPIVPLIQSIVKVLMMKWRAKYVHIYWKSIECGFGYCCAFSKLGCNTSHCK